LNNIQSRISFDEARQFDMADDVSSLAHLPSRISNSDYWYLSPLRKEKTPSFKINRELNCWYYHGIGKGGSLSYSLLLIGAVQLMIF